MNDGIICIGGCNHHAPRMILLMGMNTSLMMYPMKPITKKPIAQACRILRYSMKTRMRNTIKGGM